MWVHRMCVWAGEDRSGLCAQVCVCVCVCVCACAGRACVRWKLCIHECECEGVCALSAGEQGPSVCGDHCLCTLCVHAPECVSVPSGEHAWHIQGGERGRRAGEMLPSNLAPGGQSAAWPLAQGPALDQRLKTLLSTYLLGVSRRAQW